MATRQEERVAAIMATVIIVGSFTVPVYLKAEAWADSQGGTRVFCGEREGTAWILVTCSERSPVPRRAAAAHGLDASARGLVWSTAQDGFGRVLYSGRPMEAPVGGFLIEMGY